MTRFANIHPSPKKSQDKNEAIEIETQINSILKLLGIDFKRTLINT